jgi:hypothetical protein
MKRDLAQHEEICRLSLAKGERRVRVKEINYAEEATPHLNPLPFTKGRGGHSAGT